ncbi:MAG: hypothetical protein EBZ77_03245, partial [Chitinophagia bacterium]|nr:hypothetical protein [Chitinophagia bacterium]
MVVLLLAGYPPRLYAQRFTFQNLAVDDGLIQSQAICMAQDSTGYLWIGTLGGLSRYDGHNFVNYNIRNGLPGNMVQAVAAAPDGNIWVGTRKGLASFNGRTFTQFPIPVSEPSGLNTSQQLTVWHDTVWWRAGGMVYAIAKGKVQNAPIAGLPGRVTAMLLEDSARWFAIGDTLWVLRHGNMERHP